MERELVVPWSKASMYLGNEGSFLVHRADRPNRELPTNIPTIQHERASPPDGSCLASLAGVARGDNGQPLADARVTLVAPDGQVVAVATTGADGQYTFGDLSEGDYTVIASGYPPVAAALRVTAGQEAVHDVELGYPE